MSHQANTIFMENYYEFIEEQKDTEEKKARRNYKTKKK